jgi:hypothetical protein
MHNTTNESFLQTVAIKNIETQLENALEKCDNFSNDEKEQLIREIDKTQLNLHLLEQLILIEGSGRKSANAPKH